MDSSVAVFLVGTGASLLVSIVVVLYLRRHLRGILADLCGTQERGDFWTDFSTVLLVLVPLVLALFSRPSSDAGASLFFEVTAHLKWSLSGLVGALCSVGIVIAWFVRRPAP